MTTDHNAKPARREREKSPGKTRWWKRLLKLAVGLVLVVLVLVAAFVGALLYKHNRIVGAKPGQLQTKVQPGELGRWVNPFIGTGGWPWVCGHNFPGAMMPFGMVQSQGAYISTKVRLWMLRVLPMSNCR